VTDVTAEVARQSAALARERLQGLLVAEAPPEAEQLHAATADERLPGWACTAIITGLAALSWALVIFGLVALFSH
jgi:hypothetical protein